MNNKFIEITFAIILVPVLTWILYQLYSINRELGELKWVSQKILKIDTKVTDLTIIVCTKNPKDCQSVPQVYDMYNKENIKNGKND
jgi:hypothetical protein